MNLQDAGAAVRDWRGWVGGRLSSGEDSQLTIRLIFGLWIVGLLIKHAGSGWDVAWHFRYVFNALEPPHWVNASGSALVLALLVFQTMTGKAVERTGFLVIQIAFMVFLLSTPLDVLNHYLFGLDVSVWSPTHVLGFAATAVVTAGVLYSWLRLAEPGVWRLAIGLACWAFLLDDVVFQLGQQEYGVIALDAYARGQTTASPELLALAGRSPEQFVRGGMPPWIYPVWMILTCTLVMVAARRVQGWRWTATAATILYLAFRAGGVLLLGAGQFPTSFIPVMMLGGAFAIDLAESRRWGPLPTAAAVTVGYYAIAELVGRSTLMPEFSLVTAPIVLVALWAGLAAAGWWRQRRAERVVAQAA